MLKKYNGSSWVDAQQVRKYNGSSWQDVEFVNKYNGSSWVKIFPESLILYNAGTWNTISSFKNVSFGVNSKLVINPTNIYVEMIAKGLTASIAKPYSDIKVDLTNYTTLKITYSGTSMRKAVDGSVTVFGVYATIPKANDREDDMISITIVFSSGDKNVLENYGGVASVNVSGLSGSYYIGMRGRSGYGDGAYNKVTITKIELI